MDETPLSPDLFLFKRIVMDMLDYCKKNLKVPPFDELNIQQIVAPNKHQRIDLYHQHFLSGLANPRTRQFISKKYDHLIRENLVNKDFLPPNMITSIINARPSALGSTASSGSGSVTGTSTLQFQAERSVHIGKLVATIICSTLQPSSEICTGLNFLLEGTRNKTYGTYFYSLIQETYSSLSKYRQKPIDRFLKHFVNQIVQQVEFHEGPYFEYQKQHNNNQQQASLMTNRATANSLKTDTMQNAPPIFQFINRKGKEKQAKLCVHNTPDSKFGKCFMCEREANNYDKNHFVPLCGMECKNRLKRINSECMMNDHFTMLSWLMDTLQFHCSTDQVIFTLLLKQLPQVTLTPKDIGILVQIMIAKINVNTLGPNNVNGVMGNKLIEAAVMIFTHLLRKYTIIMLNEAPINLCKQQQILQPCFETTKIFIIQMIRLLQNLPIINSSLQLNIIKSLGDSLSITTDTHISVFRQLYIRCDCSLFQFNIIERILNILSQYALTTNTSNPSSSDALSTGVLSHPSLAAGDCFEMSIICFQNILSNLSTLMDEYDEQPFLTIGGQKISWESVYHQKQIKKYLQTSIIESFNKKPAKAIEKLCGLFDNKISGKELAIFIKNNLDYDSKLKKCENTITKSTVGEYFGQKKQKNQEVYEQFLKIIQPHFEGMQIDDCLRVVFNTFSLPKQAQQIQVIFQKLSLVLQDYLGLQKGKEGTATYQFIMAALMVQTSTNPNVKEKQKLKMEDFKGLCSRIDGGVPENRIIEVYNRINKRPLQNLFQYSGIQNFTLKYVSTKDLQTECWAHFSLDQLEKQKQSEKGEGINKNKQSPLTQSGKLEQIDEKTRKSSVTKMQENQQIERSQQSEKGEEMNENVNEKENQQNTLLSSSVLVVQPATEAKHPKPLAYTLFNLWQYVYMSLVNRNNIRGFQHSCILYGRCQLYKQFEPFFNNLYKIHTDLSDKASGLLQNISHQALLIILKLSIEYGNYVIGVKPWQCIIKLIYKRDHEDNVKIVFNQRNPENSYNFYEYESSDKLFTRTKDLTPVRLKEFMDAMCQFSSSQIATDKTYTREMYILHHITEIIQYNLKRLEIQQDNIWLIVWPTIKNYFKNICVHPRKQISMSAIDSYKQLTMKILKLNNPQISHKELIAIYLYVFQRSSSNLKDLVTNVLLNVVSKEINDGWDQIYTILQITDSEDKGVVMRVINRMIKDIGLGRIGNMVRMHQILIKQLRIAKGQAVREIIERLEEVAQYFNRMDIWLETLTYVKDIYKATTNPKILQFFYSICNSCLRCLKGLQEELELINESESQINSGGNRSRKVSEMMEEVEFAMRKNSRNNLQVPQIESAQDLSSKISEEYLDEVIQGPNNYSSSIYKYPPQLINNLIYKEVLETQIHILQIRPLKTFVEAISHFNKLDFEIVFRNIGNRERFQAGFISMWEMFLSSPHAVAFAYFLRQYFNSLIPFLKTIQTKLQGSLKNQKVNFYGFDSNDSIGNMCDQLFNWSLKFYLQSRTDSILSLCNEDLDLKTDYHELLKRPTIFSNNKVQLIEFSLPSKDYQNKSILHMIFMSILKIFYDHKFISSEDKTLKKTIDALVQSYNTSQLINDKPLLRNFLWNNDFLRGNEEYLPGLLKQQIRSYEFLVKYSSLDQRFYKIMYDFLAKYSIRLKIFVQLYAKRDKEGQAESEKNNEDSKSANSNQKFRQILLQDLGLWLTNNEQNVVLSFKKITENLKDSGERCLLKKNANELMKVCLELSSGSLGKVTLQKCSNLLQQLIEVLY